MEGVMSSAICVASGKGGTGKTSVSSGIACCLAALGYRVVVLDADVGLRNMDLVLGLSDRTVFDFTDVIAQRVSLDKALTKHPEITNLYLLAAPIGTIAGKVEAEDMKALVADIKKSFDFCIIDCPAGLGTGFNLAAVAADKAILVCTPDHASLRDAQTTRAALREKGIGDIRLVLNRVRPRLIRRFEAVNIDDSIDRTGAQLLGIVPEDPCVIACANRGKLVFTNFKAPAARAYRNIARRLLGERIPLMKI
jgi:septum site-determining protein MinD